MNANSAGKLATRGAIVVALGSPQHCTEDSIREFLGEFLSDPRVVDYPKWMWKPILNKIILPKRPAEVLEQYEAIWFPEGSPLRVHTEAQTRAIVENLSQDDDEAEPCVDVRVAYQYGTPGLLDVYADLAKTCEEITILSTYPQYAPATTGSIEDLISQACGENPHPVLTFPRSWHTLPGYITWYADQIEAALKDEGVDVLVFSWHGVPQRKAHSPEEYAEQCRETSARIMEELAKRGVKQRYIDTFQSKFGPGKWLEPATIDELPRLAAEEGVDSVLIVNPGFMADCLETIYEMDVLNAEAFHDAGGTSFRRISPPDGEAGGAILSELYRAHH